MIRLVQVRGLPTRFIGSSGTNARSEALEAGRDYLPVAGLS